MREDVCNRIKHTQTISSKSAFLNMSSGIEFVSTYVLPVLVVIFLVSLSISFFAFRKKRLGVVPSKNFQAKSREVIKEQLDKGMMNQNTSNETILGMIDDAMSPVTTYHALFFTSTRIIIALTRSMVKVWMPSVVNKSAAYDEISSRKRAQELAMMTPVDILQADKHNYYIPYTDIKTVILKKRRWMGSILTIITDDEKYMFFFKQDFEESLRLISSSMPDKVIIQ